MISAHSLQPFCRPVVDTASDFAKRVVVLSGIAASYLLKNSAVNAAYLCIYHHAMAVVKAVSLPFLVLSGTPPHAVALKRKECIQDYKKSLAYFLFLVTFGRVEPQNDDLDPLRTLFVDASENPPARIYYPSEKTVLSRIETRTILFNNILNGLSVDHAEKCVRDALQRSERQARVAFSGIHENINYTHLLQAEDLCYSLNDTQVGNCKIGGVSYKKEECHGEFLYKAFQIPTRDGFCQATLVALLEPQKGMAGVQFLQQSLVESLLRELKSWLEVGLTDGAIWSALSLACYSLHVRHLDTPLAGEGAEMSISLLINEDLWTANLGNSGVILIEGEESMRRTPDADPAKNESELRALCQEGDLRGMSSSSAFGGDDARIIPFPKITKISLKEMQQERYLVLGSKNLLETMSGRSIAAFLAKHENASLSSLSYSMLNAIASENNRDRTGSCLLVKMEPASPAVALFEEIEVGSESEFSLYQSEETGSSDSSSDLSPDFVPNLPAQLNEKSFLETLSLENESPVNLPSKNLDAILPSVDEEISSQASGVSKLSCLGDILVSDSEQGKKSVSSCKDSEESESKSGDGFDWSITGSSQKVEEKEENTSVDWHLGDSMEDESHVSLEQESSIVASEAGTLKGWHLLS